MVVGKEKSGNHEWRLEVLIGSIQWSFEENEKECKEWKDFQVHAPLVWALV